ncbi:small monomeric GTPase [Entamoeba marina]
MQHHEVRLVVLGDFGVGKSAMVVKLVSNYFVESYDPCIEDIYRTQIILDRNRVTLDILDTGGDEEYSALRDRYLRISDGFIIVYSISNRESFENVPKYYDKILQTKNVNDNINIPITIAGHKVDIENQREIPTDEGKQFANGLGVNFIECSAKEDIKIKELFETIAFYVLESEQYTNRINCEKKQKVHKCVLC